MEKNCKGSGLQDVEDPDEVREQVEGDGDDEEGAGGRGGAIGEDGGEFDEGEECFFAGA